MIENRTGEPLDEVHVRWLTPLQMTKLDVEGATLEQEHVDQDYRIYRFDHADGAARSPRDHVRDAARAAGLPQSDNERRIVDNGTFLDNTEIAPMLGMSRDGLLQDRAKRRKYGLPPELRPAKLEDESARAFNELRHDSDWVNADITVSTTADQVAIAPGYRESEHGRGRPPHGPLSHRRADQQLLLDAVGAVRGGEGPLEERRAGGLLPPGARLQRRAHARRR